jgi:quinol monooxygenase YgiN
MIVLIARLKAKPGQGKVLADVCMKMAEEVRQKEKGCLMYIPYVSPEDPTDVVIIEKYTDESVMDFHMQTPYFKALVETFKDVLGAPFDIQKFNV